MYVFVIYIIKSIKSIKSKNQKHPSKTHIQEFPKTTSQLLDHPSAEFRRFTPPLHNGADAITHTN